jgi:methyl-accepting chemotaxis protein
MKLKDMKLGHKLGLGFGFVLLLAMIASYTSFNGFLHVVDRVDKSGDVNNIKFEVLQMRRHEKDYMLRHDKKYIKQVKECINNIISISEQAREKHAKQADRDEKTRIIEAIREYENSFNEYVKAENKKDENMAIMRSSSKEVMASIQSLLERQETNFSKLSASTMANGKLSQYYRNTINLSEVERLFLEVRKGEKDIIIFHKKTYLEKLQNNYNKAIEIATEVEGNLAYNKDKVLIKGLIDHLITYKDNFDRFYESMQNQTVHNEQLVAKAHEVINLSEKAAKYQVARMFSEMSRTKSILLIFSVLTILFGIIIAAKTTTNIIRQLGGEPAEIASIAKKITTGDLTMDMSNYVDRKGAMESMLKMTLKLKEIVTNILNGTANMTSASQQISTSSQQLAQGANEQASSIEEVSTTMEEMTSNIEQNNENANQTQKISFAAQEGVREVNEKSMEAVIANQKISQKINIINDIAFKTNILALNAAVEAARAGEHGKGFAVVAAEVRKLAENSKKAAGEIVNLSQNGLKITQEAGNKLGQMLPDIEKTTSLVQEISAASTEQSNGAGQVNIAIQQLNSITQQNAAASEELATNAEEMNSLAERLKQIVNFFKVTAHSTPISSRKPIEEEIVKQPELELSNTEFESF